MDARVASVNILKQIKADLFHGPPPSSATYHIAIYGSAS